jgi:hypothetical protein
MRTYRAGIAVLAALLVTMTAAAGSASATTFGIEIKEPQLVLQRGILRFTIGLEMVNCNVTLRKTLITEELIDVEPPPFLTRIGRVMSGRIALECGILFLNLPPVLGGIPGPGPNPESWDISFLSSNLPEGELNFGILDFQIIFDQFPEDCLYRGTLLGTLSTDGRILRYASPLPLFSGLGCPETVAVEGIFTNQPAINYSLLP